MGKRVVSKTEQRWSEIAALVLLPLIIVGMGLLIAGSYYIRFLGAIFAVMAVPVKPAKHKSVPIVS